MYLPATPDAQIYYAEPKGIFDATALLATPSAKAAVLTVTIDGPLEDTTGDMDYFTRWNMEVNVSSANTVTDNITQYASGSYTSSSYTLPWMAGSGYDNHGVKVTFSDDSNLNVQMGFGPLAEGTGYVTLGMTSDGFYECWFTASGTNGNTNQPWSGASNHSSRYYVSGVY